MSRGGFPLSRVVSVRLQWLVVLGALWTLLAPARAAAEWQPVGGWLNVNPYHDANGSQLVSIGGTPYVAWTEDTPRNGYEVRVAGDVNGVWTPVGGAVDPNPTKGGAGPGAAITSIGGVPWVAWSDGNFSGCGISCTGTSVIRVATLVAGRWSWVGAALNVSLTLDGNAPQIVNVGGVPWVAWTEGSAEAYPTPTVEDFVRIAYYANGAWMQVPGPGDESDTTNFNPSLAVVNGVPWIAWVDEDRILVARYDNGGWTQVGPEVSLSPAYDAPGASLTNVGGVPWVAWTEGAPDGSRPDQVMVARWDGSAWNRVGGPLNASMSADAEFPTIAAVAGVPYVTWTESQGFMPPRQIRVARLSGTTWSAVAGPVNVNAALDAGSPSLADFGNTPWLAWVEDSGVITHDPSGSGLVRVACYASVPAACPPAGSDAEPPPPPGPPPLVGAPFIPIVGEPPGGFGLNGTQRIVSLRSNSRGLITIADNVPWIGRIIAVGKATLADVHSRASAITYAQTKLHVKRAGRVNVVLVPTRAAHRLLARHREVIVRIMITFTPIRGAAQRATALATLLIL